jgi:HNH endonuclease
VRLGNGAVKGDLMAEYETSKLKDEDVRHDDLVAVDRLRECFSYDAKTGILRWKIRPTTNVAIGDVAGCSDHRGYRYVRLDRQLLLAHRIAWAIHYRSWPEYDLDHRNMDKSDNRIVNLRLAARPQNNANAPALNHNGLPKGCYQLKGRQRWYSQIKIDGKIKRLGTFATIEEAAAAFRREHRVIHGEFSQCDAR